MLDPEVPPTALQALEELHELLDMCCQDQFPPRHVPNRYQICRAALMTGEYASLLPGFLAQCPSSIRFREFIHLYHRQPEKRMAFVEQSLETCWAKLTGHPAPARLRSGEPGASPARLLPQSRIEVQQATPARAMPIEDDDFMAEPDSPDDGFLWAERLEPPSKLRH